jgi:threonine/homoserine/homoserine lactone efflux protein
MVEILLTLFSVGLIAGIVYSMPIAGPISIIIVSNALQGKLRFCMRTAIGSAIVEFVYVFIVVYGITTLYEVYQPAIPYMLLVGALIVIIVGIKIIRHKMDLDSLEMTMINTDKYENRGGFRTGLAINASNPSLFFNWLIASFMTLSLVSSIGLNTGGLDLILNENIKSVTDITGTEFEDVDELPDEETSQAVAPRTKKVGPFTMSLIFALGVGVGAYIWLYTLTKLIIIYRDRIKASWLNRVIFSLGIILIIIGGYLGYRAVMVFIG